MNGHSGLSQNDECEVTECECGHITVRIGRTRIELTREEFVQLQQAIADAAARFSGASAPPRSRRALTH